MADPVPMGNSSGSQRKADFVADVINRLLSELAIRCAKDEGVRNYFHLGLIGYGASVASGLQGLLAGRDVVPISDVAMSPLRLETRSKKVPDGAGGLVEQTVKFPVWIEPTASGGTPMCEAIQKGSALVRQWLQEHPTCFPPIVLHVTDGESTDGDPGKVADELKALSSTDGNVLFLNLHVSSDRSAPVIYPDGEAALPNDFARLLFRISSPLPGVMQAYARKEGLAVGEGARGLVFNADPKAITEFFDIGTRVSSLR